MLVTFFVPLFVLGIPVQGENSYLKEIYLSDLMDTISVRQGWGNPGINTAAWAPGTSPMAMRIGEKEFSHGVGHHAYGEINIPLNYRYSKFKTKVGVQWQGGNKGSVVFVIAVDGEERLTMPVMSDSDNGLDVEMDLSGAKTLQLIAKDGGDGIACDMANWAEARLVCDSRIPRIGPSSFSPDDGSASLEGSYGIIGPTGGTQFAFCRPLDRCAVAVKKNEPARILLPMESASTSFAVKANIKHSGGAIARVCLTLASGPVATAVISSGHASLEVNSSPKQKGDGLILEITGVDGDVAIQLTRFDLQVEERLIPIVYLPPHVQGPPFPTPNSIVAHPLLEEVFIEWDWRMQDGISCGRGQNSYKSALETLFQKGETIYSRDYIAPANRTAWKTLREEYKKLSMQSEEDNNHVWESLWYRVHRLKRAMMLEDPRIGNSPLIFVKQAPPVFSHQLTQYYGRYARPGGGVFLLEKPGHSMHTRELTAGLSPGCWMHPELSYDGQTLFAAFCAVDRYPDDTFRGTPGNYYHIYRLHLHKSQWHRLTEGPFDDFSPCQLPNGDILFISTRRGGWHRCGTPGCEVYTLTSMKPEGSDIRTLSYHETQEWDPAVLNDGRVIYTRWDYVDRDAVHYQQLWTTRPDGTAPSAYYGNNTFNPVGVWEARPVPGSRKIMATAAAHHAMTAGTIVLIDRDKGMDGLDPLLRLTPHVPFPESESKLLPHWRTAIPYVPESSSPEMERWLGQCYRSPWPISEDLFYAAYSFDPLIGEPIGNPANMFGLYIVDAYGNKELLYRDLSISSLWPVPLRPRTAPPILPTLLDENADNTGTYFLQNVYEGDPPLPKESKIVQLRIVQILPKSTPGANNPTVGMANASPGKQVLGVVPVEPDGSAFFRAPARIPLAFQALDGSGQAVQIMRSITYLQPGENASCIGCHEKRHQTSSSSTGTALALMRPPSVIKPGPDGSKPLSFPLLVQPVLDKHCISCHAATAESSQGPSDSPVRLTGAPEGQYTQSYNSLSRYVSFSAWGRGPFPSGNCEPLTQPEFFGAKGSKLTKLLLAGHNDVKLEPDDWDRLNTWMDANALFYGTFNFADQERQKRAERIEGPDLE